MRLEGKVAVIVGAGQSPGEGIGNGRATTLRSAPHQQRRNPRYILAAAHEEHMDSQETALDQAPRGR